MIESWMHTLTGKLKDTFGERLLFVGLQGSYKRGEAHEDSDIDAVVILDTLSLEDLKEYKSILAAMPDREKSCGFISGKQELKDWPRHELFQFAHDTRPLFGSLAGLLPEIQRQDIIDSVKNGVSGHYHTCCHSYLHGDPIQLKGLYKGAFFILLAVYYLRHGKYIETKGELRSLLSGTEQEILTIGMDWQVYQEKIVSNPDEYYGTLIRWCAAVLHEAF